ncbi:hypothetical protein [Kordia sp.]|uniref:hypothetical protein n=1 Tax=Kordia sp. TaxID=1965332 RepID=UPI003B5A4134
MTRLIFKETLKVFIVMYTLTVILGATLMLVESLKDIETYGFIQIIILSLVIASGILSVFFHVQTYSYYSKIRRKRKFPRILWLAAFALPSSVIFKIVKDYFTIFYHTDTTISQDMPNFVFTMFILFSSILGIIEVVLMPKRIKKQHDLLNLTDEFDDIGNSTL